MLRKRTCRGKEKGTDGENTISKKQAFSIQDSVCAGMKKDNYESERVFSEEWEEGRDEIDENDREERHEGENDQPETEGYTGVKILGLNSGLWILELGTSLAMIVLIVTFYYTGMLNQPNFEATGLQYILPLTNFFSLLMDCIMMVYFRRGDETMLLLSLRGYIFGSTFVIFCKGAFFAVLYTSTELTSMDEFSGYEQLHICCAPWDFSFWLSRIILARTFTNEIIEHREHDRPHKDCEHCHMKYSPGLSYEEWMDGDWD